MIYRIRVRACSRLYRSQILKVNTRWKALAEIYTTYSFAPFSWSLIWMKRSNLNFFVKSCWKCCWFFANFWKFCQNFAWFLLNYNQFFFIFLNICKVSNLDWSVKEGELDTLFGAMPGMATIRLVKDYLGRNKGYASLVFAWCFARDVVFWTITGSLIYFGFSDGNGANMKDPFLIVSESESGIVSTKCFWVV